jgi:hypothetical protein
MKKPTLTGKGNLDTLILIAAVAALFFVFKGIKGILEATNIIKDKEERQAEKEVKDAADKSVLPPVLPKPSGFEEFNISGDPFNANYYTTISRAASQEAAKKGKLSNIILTEADTINYRAKAIYESIGFLYDKTGEAVAQFKKCKYKTQVSQLCAKFNSKYGQDCFSWMKNKFDTQEQIKDLAEIVAYVNNLPSGAYIYPKGRSINEIAIKK